MKSKKINPNICNYIVIQGNKYIYYGSDLEKMDDTINEHSKISNENIEIFKINKRVKGELKIIQNTFI